MSGSPPPSRRPVWSRSPEAGATVPSASALQLGEGPDRRDLEPRDQRRLGSIRERHDDPRGACTSRRLGHRQRAPDLAHAAVQPELSGQRPVAQQPLGQLARGDEDRGGDRQVEARPGLAQVRGRKADRDPLQREVAAGVGDRRPHPLAALAHGRVGQPDDREGRQPPVDVDLGIDGDRLDPGDRECPGHGEHPIEACPGSAHGWATGRAEPVPASCRIRAQRSLHVPLRELAAAAVGVEAEPRSSCRRPARRGRRGRRCRCWRRPRRRYRPRRATVR